MPSLWPHQLLRTRSAEHCKLPSFCQLPLQPGGSSSYREDVLKYINDFHSVCIRKWKTRSVVAYVMKFDLFVSQPLSRVACHFQVLFSVVVVVSVAAVIGLLIIFVMLMIYWYGFRWYSWLCNVAVGSAAVQMWSVRTLVPHGWRLPCTSRFVFTLVPHEWMNEWKCEDFKCVWKPTESRLCLTHYVNKSSRWAK